MALPFVIHKLSLSTRRKVVYPPDSLRSSAIGVHREEIQPRRNGDGFDARTMHTLGRGRKWKVIIEVRHRVARPSGANQLED